MFSDVANYSILFLTLLIRSVNFQNPLSLEDGGFLHI